MAGTQPVAVYALKVPPGDFMVPAVPDFAAMFRVSMAAIDPTEELDEEGKEENKPLRATLKLIRPSNDYILDDDDDDDDDEDMMDLDEADLEETVVCTLDPAQHYQQPLDLVVGEDEKIFFKVIGTHTIHLTGNYVIPADDGRASMYDEDEYDLSPDEDEVDEFGEDEEEDELDDMEDPRVTELDTDEEDAPKLVQTELKAEIKSNKKRPAPDSSDAEDATATLDDIMAKSLKPAEPTATEEPKLSKAQLKKLRKKQKKNDGEAAAVTATTTVEAPSASNKPDVGKKEPITNGEKKVQFAENLEQGPTPSSTPKSDNSQSTTTGKLGIKTVQGVLIDDRKLGKGPTAKKGDRVGVRYIGKLVDGGKVFDANKKGKPFSFKVGAGEVIRGWEVGILGMSVGGERRITVPPSLAYGSKGQKPDIPENAKLQFDLKMLELK